MAGIWVWLLGVIWTLARAASGEGTQGGAEKMRRPKSRGLARPREGRGTTGKHRSGGNYDGGVGGDGGRRAAGGVGAGSR